MAVVVVLVVIVAVVKLCTVQFHLLELSLNSLLKSKFRFPKKCRIVPC